MHLQQSEAYQEDAAGNEFETTSPKPIPAAHNPPNPAAHPALSHAQLPAPQNHQSPRQPLIVELISNK